MTPQPPPAQQSWFGRNWKWLVGLGCLGSLLCCGGFSVVAALLNPELQKAIDVKVDPAKPAGEPGTDDALPSARVDCGTPGPDGVDCTIKRTGGSAGLQACWDLEITCTNGGKMVGHACGPLAAGRKSVVVNLPVSSFSNQDQCDAPASGAVQELVVTAE